MKIGELADTAGLSTQAIRYYENIGLLPEPEREANGYRTYGTRTVDRLSFIQDAQAAGLSLVEIQMILELRDQGESTCGHVIFLLEEKVDDISRQMDELARAKERLRETVKRARGLNPSECRDPVRCQTISDNMAIAKNNRKE